MVTLFIGLDRDGQGRPLGIDTVAAVLLIKRKAAELFGGYSASIVSGGWINPDGRLIEERSLRLELATDLDVTEFAHFAGSALCQSSVMVRRDVVSSVAFIDTESEATA